jgi:hypothetical protein
LCIASIHSARHSSSAMWTSPSPDGASPENAFARTPGAQQKQGNTGHSASILQLATGTQRQGTVGHARIAIQTCVRVGFSGPAGWDGTLTERAGGRLDLDFRGRGVGGGGDADLATLCALQPARARVSRRHQPGNRNGCMLRGAGAQEGTDNQRRARKCGLLAAAHRLMAPHFASPQL